MITYNYLHYNRDPRLLINTQAKTHGQSSRVFMKENTNLFINIGPIEILANPTSSSHSSKCANVLPPILHTNYVPMTSSPRLRVRSLSMSSETISVSDWQKIIDHNTMVPPCPDHPSFMERD